MHALWTVGCAFELESTSRCIISISVSNTMNTMNHFQTRFFFLKKKKRTPVKIIQAFVIFYTVLHYTRASKRSIRLLSRRIGKELCGVEVYRSVRRREEAGDDDGKGPKPSGAYVSQMFILINVFKRITRPDARTHTHTSASVSAPVPPARVTTEREKKRRERVLRLFTLHRNTHME